MYVTKTVEGPIDFHSILFPFPGIQCGSSTVWLPCCPKYLILCSDEEHKLEQLEGEQVREF